MHFLLKESRVLGFLQRNKPRAYFAAKGDGAICDRLGERPCRSLFLVKMSRKYKKIRCGGGVHWMSLLWDATGHLGLLS